MTPKMTKFEREILGLDKIQYYNYRCPDCNFETNVEDVVVDSFPPSPNSKYGMPELECICGGTLVYVKDLKSAR